MFFGLKYKLKFNHCTTIQDGDEIMNTVDCHCFVIIFFFPKRFMNNILDKDIKKKQFYYF